LHASSPFVERRSCRPSIFDAALRARQPSNRQLPDERLS